MPWTLWCRVSKEASHDVCAIVAESLFRMATGTGRNAVTAAIFWLKTQVGWREIAVVHNLTLGVQGEPIDLTKPVSTEQAQRDYWEMVACKPSAPCR